MKKIKSFTSFVLVLSLLMSLMGCESSNDSSRRRDRRNRDRDHDRHRNEVEETEETEETIEETGRITSAPVETIVETEPVSGSNQYTADGKVIINLWSFTDEVPQIVDTYMELHPEFAEEYEVRVTIYSSIEGAYQDNLATALMNGGDDAPDIYCLESDYMYDYTQGYLSSYAATYDELGITSADINNAQIVPFVVDVGTRSSDNSVIGLSYQSCPGVFIYRRSIATEVFGTDDPDVISEFIGGGSGNWDAFMNTAVTLADSGVAIVSGNEDLWQPINGTSSSPWVVDGRLVISPERESFLDYSMDLSSNNWTNNTMQWYLEWYYDFSGTGEKPCFGFFGPAWFINYTMVGDCQDTYGDWAICTPPVGFYWGGTWLFANERSSAEKKAGIAELLRWITVDTSTDGLQYMWASGIYNWELKDTVASLAVMSNADGSIDFLGGQNMFDVFVPASIIVNEADISPYDDDLAYMWRGYVRQYIDGDMTRDEALEYFRTYVYEQYGIPG